MNRSITDTSSLSGANMILVLVAVLFTGVLCVVGYSIRWVPWCNISAVPYTASIWNILCVMVSAAMTAFVAKAMIPVGKLWHVVVMYMVFWAMLPTCMFFSDYIVANTMVSVAIYALCKIEGTGAKAYIFFASFIIGLAMWWVPVVALYMIVVYAAVFIFAPQDIRHWLIPLVGIAAAVIVSMTYLSLQNGAIIFPAVYDITEMFHMPYTEKVFAARTMYFYVGVLAVIAVVAYSRYISMAGRDTQQEKKQALYVSVIWLTAILIAICVKESRYMIVFSAMPFAMVVARYVTDDNVSKIVRMASYWGIVIMAAVSMFIFE